MVIRLTAFHQALRGGQFPVRWLPRLNHGYGYPVTNFLYPLPFYLAEPFYALTGNPATAIQIVMGLSVVSMAVGMYVFLSALITSHHSLITNHKFSVFSFPSFVGSAAYVYSPYVAFNLYQRGSLGELVAMGIAPWVFWAVNRGQWLLGSIALSGLILSHNVVAILFFPLILLFMLLKIIQKKRDFRLSLATYYLLLTTLALGASAFFWLPALAELRYVRASTIVVSDFQNEYLSPDVAFKRAGHLSTVANLGFPLYFLTDASRGFWETFPILQVIQFPWRLLSVFSFTGAVITAAILSQMRRMKAMAVVLGAVVILVSFQSSRYFYQPLTINHQPSSYYETNDDTTTVRAEYTPIWVKELPAIRPAVPETHYYPGWRAFLNGKEIAVLDPRSTNGVLKSAAPADRIEYKWSETPLRAFSNLTSLISLVALLWWEYWRQKEKERGQRRHIRAST